MPRPSIDGALLVLQLFLNRKESSLLFIKEVVSAFAGKLAIIAYFSHDS